MKLKRRQVLLLAGLGVLGSLGGVATGLTRRLWAAWQLRGTTSQAQPQPEQAAAPQPTASVSPLRLVAVGDVGEGASHQNAVATAMANHHATSPFSLVLLVGDNIYPDGDINLIGPTFEQPYKPLLDRNVQFRAALGNHDIRTANGDPQVQYSGYNMEGRYYSFRQGPAEFFMLNTNDAPEPDPWATQMAWLKQKLQQSQQAQVPWKIVCGHHPIYSSGYYGNDQHLIQQLTPLFREYGVQLYINGHEHSYERTQPIQGTTYLITGIGGAYLRDVRRSSWTAYAEKLYGFTALDIHPDRLEIQALDTQNRVFDRATL